MTLQIMNVENQLLGKRRRKMNHENRNLIQEKKWGRLDMNGPLFHEFVWSGYSWPIIVSRPCIYTEKIGNIYTLVLCWKNQEGVQTEFLLNILIEKFGEKFRDHPLSTKILFVGRYDVAKETFKGPPLFSIGPNRYKEQDFILFGEIRKPETFTLKIDPFINSNQKNFYPKLFKNPDYFK